MFISLFAVYRLGFRVRSFSSICRTRALVYGGSTVGKSIDITLLKKLGEDLNRFVELEEKLVGGFLVLSLEIFKKVFTVGISGRIQGRGSV